MAEKKSKAVRIEVDCIYRGIIYTRTFVTPNNNEAINMLMNKLDRKGIVDQGGKLFLSLFPEKKKQ